MPIVSYRTALHIKRQGATASLKATHRLRLGNSEDAGVVGDNMSYFMRGFIPSEIDIVAQSNVVLGTTWNSPRGTQLTENEKHTPAVHLLAYLRKVRRMPDKLNRTSSEKLSRILMRSE